MENQEVKILERNLTERLDGLSGNIKALFEMVKKLQTEIALLQHAVDKNKNK